MSDLSENSDSDLEDNTENFIENHRVLVLADGFLNFFTPIVENLDIKIKNSV